MPNLSNVLQYFIPQPCPYPLVRIGGDSDGGYLVPNDFDGITACFSPGVFNTKDFEDELAQKYNIRSHMCDFSSDQHLFKTPLIDGMQTFKKVWLDLDNTPSSITLNDWVKQAMSDDKGDLMLQMDIEGAEYRNLVCTPAACLKRFRIIILEIHYLETFKASSGDDSAINRWAISQTSNLWLQIMRGAILLPNNNISRKIVYKLDYKLKPALIGHFARKIAKTHICVHAHPNNYRGEFIDESTGMNVPHVLELTYLRKDRFKGIEAEFISPKIPHPLDIQNCPLSLPLELNSKWSRDRF